MKGVGCGWQGVRRLRSRCQGLKDTGVKGVGVGVAECEEAVQQVSGRQMHRCDGCGGGGGKVTEKCSRCQGRRYEGCGVGAAECE